jgi:5-methylcytosine-specific restriction endonuclease McrA
MSDISWQEACRDLYTGKGTALHYYDNWVVRSEKLEFRVPAVMILKEQVIVKRRLKCETSDTAPSSPLVFMRDGYLCQYCHGKFSERDLTIDHVIPKKFGGKTTWVNCTTACQPCNGKRGHDVRIQPRIKPFRPTYSHLIKMMKRFPIFVPHETWNYYLGWKEELVNIIPPTRNVVTGRSFYNDKRVKIIESVE